MEKDNTIYDCVGSYEKIYKEQHATNVNDYFNELVKSSGVNEEENALTVNEIKKTDQILNNTQTILSKKKKLKTFLIVMCILFFIGGVGILYSAIAEEPLFVNKIADIAISVGPILLMVLFIVLIAKKVSPQINDLKNNIDSLITKRDGLVDEAWNQTYNLNILYDWGMSEELLQKTLPLISMDKAFDSKRFDILHNKYGLVDTSNTGNSAMFVQSGELVGNPFVLGRRLVHEMSTKIYSGSLNISWVETRKKSDGRVERITRTQTLTASVSKPYPKYFTDSFLVYGNEAAPDLSFTRYPKGYSSLSEKELDKKIKKGSKKIEKIANKSLNSGDNFTAMSNEEFDVLFQTLDRDHEVQYRLLFTPLAQKEMINIIKDNRVGFGDDFSFIKSNTLNTIYPDHLNKIDLDGNPQKYVSYDVSESRKRFNWYNNDYFKSVYFTFAPIMAIPLYQQHKPREYIYKDVYDSNVSCWQHESIVNGFDQSVFKHPNSHTDNILKTELIKKTGDVDEVSVTAYGYQGFDEVDYVSVHGGDGYYHNVPVYWVNYCPVHKTSTVAIKSTDKVKRADYCRNNQDWKDYFTAVSGSTDYMSYNKNFVSYLTKNGFTAEDGINLEKFINKEND